MRAKVTVAVSEQTIIIDQLESAYRKALKYYRRPYVNGIAIGQRFRNGQYLPDDIGVCIHVEEKFPKTRLTKRQLFPTEIEGVPVDVCERAFISRSLSPAEANVRRRLVAETARPGIQLGNESGGVGTLGMIVVDGITGGSCVLSAAHLLYDSSSPVIYQPSKYADQGGFATFSRMIWGREGDAAIALIDPQRAFNSVPMGFGFEFSGIRAPNVGDILTKSGSRTGVTQGQVSKTGRFDVQYEDGITKSISGFELYPVDPADLSEISDEGDSGAIWYDADSGQAVGLTVAGDPFGKANADEWVFACNLTTVFPALNIHL